MRRTPWLLAALLAAASPGAPAGQTLYFGSVASESPTVMIGRMTPLTAYLSARTGLTVRFKPAPNLAQAVADLASGETSIAYLTPVAYLEARAKAGAMPLASPLTRGVKTFSLVVAVRAESPLKECAQLRGSTFAFGDRKALLQKAIVEECLGDVSALRRIAHLDHYDNIAKALLFGDFEAGILKDTVFDEYASRGLRKLHESQPLPGYLVAASPRLGSEDRRRIREALLTITSSPQGREALGQLDPAYTGFAAVEDREYDAVRRLVRRPRKPASRLRPTPARAGGGRRPAG